MGYDMDLVDCDFRIRKQNFARALTSLKALVSRPTKPDEDFGPCFGWREELAKAETLDAALRLWGWKLETDSAKNVVGILLEGGGKKFLNDDVLFETIAPFVEKGSFIEMQGADRSLWQWEFDGKKLVTKEGRVVYD